MRKTVKILNLATALGAIAGPTVAPEIANTGDSDEAHIAKASGTNAETTTNSTAEMTRGVELMSFTAHQNSDGMMIPQHVSHASHASHASSSY